jgi:hypothetical protein
MSWDSLAAEENDLQPTPPVGWGINWFPGGDTSNPQAATITAIEGPGKIAVVCFPPGGWPVHHKGVHYVHHPVVKRDGSQQKVRNGSWNYIPDSGKIPNSHMKLHQEVVAKKKSALEQAEADRKKREEQGKKPALATV